jgi:acetoacetyl-CoA synthetase
VREDGQVRRLSWDALRAQVGAAQAGLRRLGVGAGDRVVAVLPTSLEALVAFLATASLGAVWSSCSPDFGPRSLVDRFSQVEPTVLLGVDGYSYGGRTFDTRPTLAEVRGALPSLRATVLVPYADPAATAEGTVPWAELVAQPAEPAYARVSFDAPLWILYSSGTTGLPKPIVQGQGGILLEHLKSLGLHNDLGEGDRFFWFTTTGWMMWNYLVSGLLVGATVVMYDGNPAFPDLGALWRLADEHGVTCFGTSAPYLASCISAGVVPREQGDVSRLRTVATTGAPLSPEGARWVYDAVADPADPDLQLANVSGGTDLCTAFAQSHPWLPVRAGEIQCGALGAAVAAYDPDGLPVVDELGELVITRPMPSMPVAFWGDEDGSRLTEAYFADFPGVWRHGDWAKVSPSGSIVIYGRSDSTLNRGGVRIGTAEFYRVVEDLPEVADSLVVDTGGLGRSEDRLLLFVVLREGQPLDDDLLRRLRSTIRSELSPRHVPDEVFAVPEVPRTLNGKKLEVPVKRLLTGTPFDKAVSLSAVANPDALEHYVALAQGGP